MRQSPVLSLRGLAMLCMVLFLHLATRANVHQFDFKVTLKAEQVALKNVMKDIEKQTGLYFMYSATGGLKINDPVSIHVTNAKLEDVLETLLEVRGISWSIIDKAIVLKSGAVKNKENKETKEAMFRTVSGSVLDKDGQPLPGATVQIKGTNIGTTTAVTGIFSLANVPTKQLVIQARYTGYESQEKVLTEGNIVFNLNPSVSNLDETVVVAYGTSTKRSVTGAVSVVKGEEIRTLPNRSFDKSLQGLVPGLRISNGTGQPGGGVSNMIVRGISTGTEALGGSTVRNPLIVIDGMQVTQDIFNRMGPSDPFTPLTNPLAQINPDDIAEISVLKDAAAIALYGSKASNGVIMVTTKRGRSGKTKFNFSHQTDASMRPASIPKMLNQSQYLELLYETYRNTDPTTWTDEAIRADLFKKFPYQTIGNDTSFYPQAEWDNEIYNHPAITLSNNLSVSGGTPNQTFYLNFEYTKQNGIIKSTGYERASLRVNLDNRITDWLKFGISSTFSYNLQKAGYQSEGPYAGAPSTDILSPLLPIRTSDGSYIKEFTWGTLLNTVYPNPIFERDYNLNKTSAFRGLTTMNADVSFLRHFNFTTSLGVDYMQTENKQKIDPRLSNSGGGYIRDYDTRNANLLWMSILKYQTQIGRHHHIDVLAGQEAQIQNNKNLYLSVKGSFGQQTNPYYTDVVNPEYVMDVFLGGTLKRTSLSQFVHLNYDYRKKYNISGSWRRDGASVFGDSNPFGNYWSLGGAWIISEENFMQPIKNVIPFLKLRGSIGLAGNAGAVNHLLRYHLLSRQLFMKDPAVMPGTSPGNPTIKWEKTSQWNGGLQAGLLNNRLTADVDLYYKFTKNLIYQTILPSFTGYASVMDNIGDIRNSGIELSLSGDIIRRKDLRVALRGNWSKNSNKLLKANKNIYSVSNIMSNEEGREMNSYFMPVWAGVNPANGMPQWLDSSMKPTQQYNLALKQFVGRSQPDAFGSITSTVTWKNLELQAMFYYQYGGLFYNEVNSLLLTDGLRAYHNVPVTALNRWQKPGDIAENPVRLLSNNNSGAENSTRYLQKSDYIRFQNLKLTWRIPRKWLSPARVQDLSIDGQVNNLALWATADDVDPDNVNLGGRGGFAYPNSRTYSIRLNVSF
ncbi:SusC/RagA family TonB-linked outer membrane protein [Chitinophaga barathri]|uniref:SusC/RagA family TonB-linked outer membrane protein n=1 Tax=Chitinophaga barathri TaxID=1647451 RepID=A0A3N4MDA0_9BACT|nr:SusC/RagA family TonB-linked outer membrane protein [Chitinophaga barathri]RPD41844.1 SusC/RagA family TonB-linked outer membrane protein [Chitinophaga barathri]